MNLLDQTEDDLPKIDESKNYLEELVGEGKKFRTAEELAKGKAYSDSYVTLLEKRLDILTAEDSQKQKQLTAGARIEELLAKLDKLPIDQLTSSEQQMSNEANAQNYNPDDVKKIALDLFTEQRQAEKEADNFLKVTTRLEEKFGDNYKGIVKEQSKQLGLSDEQVNEMARKNPTLFFKTFDLTAVSKDAFQSPPRSQNSFTPKGAPKRNWAYYEGLRKTNPLIWMDKKTAVQMEKDAQAMGPSFYDA